MQRNPLPQEFTISSPDDLFNLIKNTTELTTEHKTAILGYLSNLDRSSSLKASYIGIELNAKTKINAVDENGDTALILAIKRGKSHQYIVDTLLGTEREVVHRYKTKETDKRPAHNRFIDRLIKPFKDIIDINARDKEGRTVLVIATAENNIDAINMLINFDRDSDTPYHTLLGVKEALNHAFLNGYHEIFEQLLSIVQVNAMWHLIADLINLQPDQGVNRDQSLQSVYQLFDRLGATNGRAAILSILHKINATRREDILKGIFEFGNSSPAQSDYYSFMNKLISLYSEENGGPNKDPFAAACKYYREIKINELTAMINRALTSADIKLIDNLISSKHAVKLSDSVISNVLWKWIDNKNLNTLPGPMIDGIRAYFAAHKDQLKNVFLPIIEKLSTEEQARITKQIFDCDKKYTGNALAEVFWAGHISLSRGRLMDVYNIHLRATGRSAMADLFDGNVQPAVSSVIGKFRNLFKSEAVKEDRPVVVPSNGNTLH